MGKWLSKFTNKVETSQDGGDKVDIVKKEPALSTMSPPTPQDLRKLSLSVVAKREELRRLITDVSNKHGGDESQFLASYIKDILANQDLDDSLDCFRRLAQQAGVCKKQEITGGHNAI